MRTQSMGHLHGPQSAMRGSDGRCRGRGRCRCSDHLSTLNLYRYDPNYALEVYGNIRTVWVAKPIDVNEPAIGDVCADWAKTDGAVGVRTMLRDELVSDPADARLNHALAAAGKHGLLVNFLCGGRLNDGAELIRRNADTVIVIDHLGCCSRTSRRCRWSHGPILRSCSLSQPIQASGSKSAIPARYGASHSHTTTSGSRSYTSSMHLASTAACGALIEQVPVGC